ncbi:hypothetical protein Agabi119p4_932 [Agaricus bisporus var. burnettii]|uniref:Uncharacterized protein n=1 Tax=Agaricus bisporus var. burnettii TaxID=192524 RepID=A0A8H7KLI4_AGABI|nr:hypothetical protein Agabi119p4_932 [Agaricus bisporus var. burnettii]
MINSSCTLECPSKSSRRRSGAQGPVALSHSGISLIRSPSLEGIYFFNHLHAVFKKLFVAPVPATSPKGR